MRVSFISIALGLVALVGCADLYKPTPRPDYTIHVTPSANGGVAAIPPACPSWSTATTNPYDNKPLPQLGCATARNLAMMIEQPEDLVRGRELGSASGVTAVGSMLRYNANQTRGLMWTGVDPNQQSNTTSSAPASAISGEPKPSSGGSSSTPAAAP